MLGHRDTAQKPLGNVLIALWSMVGTFCSVALISEITKRVPAFESRDVPTIVGSFVSHPLAWYTVNCIAVQCLACNTDNRQPS